MFKPASKAKAKLRMAIMGPSGSGKTFTALEMAQHLGENVGLIDTEHGSASKYADLFNFDVTELSNFHPNKYIEAINTAGRMGYDVLIVDSLSHAWFWELDASANSNSGNSFTAWARIRPLERALINALLSYPGHVIVTMRSKTEWVTEQTFNKKGESVTSPRRVGTAPVQASGIEYEFDVAGEIDLAHVLTISKSRCSKVADTQQHYPGEILAKSLLAWLDDGVEPAPAALNESTVQAEPPSPSREQAIANIGVELQRLGWTTEAGKTFLKQRYGRESRQRLDHAELNDCLSHLRQLQPVSEPAETLV